MNIELITPDLEQIGGNRITALRYARILRKLGHKVTVNELYSGRGRDLLIALHARRSAASVAQFRDLYPDRPLVLVMTGTDLYRDILSDGETMRSIECATRLVVLQPMGVAELPEHVRDRTRVIYQSSGSASGRVRPADDGFRVCVVANLRPEKDPLRTAEAARLLRPDSRVEVVHVGRSLSADIARLAGEESRENPRYRWLGEQSHEKTREILARSRLVSITSVIEGGSNTLSEAIRSGVPVVATRISGLVGTLGEDYPGYFRVGDTAALAELMERAESDEDFYGVLRERIESLAELVEPDRERDSWRELLGELVFGGAGAATVPTVAPRPNPE